MAQLAAALVDRLGAATDLITLAAALFLAAWLAERHAGDEGLDPSDVASASTWLGVAAIVGARLAFALPNWPTYVRHPIDLIYVQSGLWVWGGMLGALAAGIWLHYRRGLPLARLADLFAPYLALGAALYDVLCPMRGTCGGVTAPFPIGVILPGSSQPRIPVALWEAAFMLTLYWLLVERRRRRRFPGELGLLFIIGFSAIRAAADFLRLNIGGFPTADQSLAILAIALAVVGWAWQARRASPQTPI